MNFEFATAGRVIFGPGAFGQLKRVADEFGRRALVVTGARGAEFSGEATFPVAAEPVLDTIREGVRIFRESECDHVVAIGGGSVLDAGKAIAAAAANPGDLLDYLEIIGKGRPLDRDPYPFLAVPTTAGTGSEVTRNAVIGSPAHGIKVSLRSPRMLARVAIVDPNLSLGLPPLATAAAGLDALTQLIEPYVSLRANPFVDSFCLDGIKRISRNVQRAVSNGSDIAARTEMSYASLLGGMALANSGLGVVHGFAAAIGGTFNAPHGAVCAAVLPYGMQANIAALSTRDPQGSALDRYCRIARILTGDEYASPTEGAAWAERLIRDLQIPRLRTYGVTRDAAEELARKASRANSIKANPVELTPDELMAVIEAAI